MSRRIRYLMTVRAQLQAAPAAEVAIIKDILKDLSGKNPEEIFAGLKARLPEWDYAQFSAFLDHCRQLLRRRMNMRETADYASFAPSRPALFDREDETAFRAPDDLGRA